jgi:hypothetical protein
MKFAVLMSAVAVLALPVSPVLANGTTETEAAKLDPKDPNYVRCRKLSVTGSLVKKERICKTNAEWAKASEDAQRNADDLITRNRVGTNGQ